MKVSGPVHAYESAPLAVNFPVTPAQIEADETPTVGNAFTITDVVAIPVHPPIPATVTV